MLFLSSCDGCEVKSCFELATALNPLIKKRFEDALKKMQADLEMKLAQRDAIAEERARRRARAVE